MSTLNSSMPPATAEYGGDEIGAIVLDPGYSTIRAGFAGEDIPKSVVPSFYGVLPAGPNGEKKLLFGDNAVNTPLPNLDIQHFMSNDGAIQDWDMAKKVWEYSITSRLTNSRPGLASKNGLNDLGPGEADEDMNGGVDAVEDAEKPLWENPLLMTENGHNSAKEREKFITIAMEDWGVPAFWLAKTGVLSAFASGKHTALVIDVGASTVSVTAVHDGMVLKKGTTRSHFAGNYVSSQTRRLFATSDPPISLTPHYLINSKIAVDAGQPAQATLKSFPPNTAPADSFRRFQEERVLHEFKESVVHVWTGGPKLSAASQEEINSRVASRPFELPDGYNQLFGPVDRPRPAEFLFDAKNAIPDPDHPGPTAGQTVSDLIRASINSVDTDIRVALLNHVIVVGGGSLMQGFVERLDAELKTMFPSIRSRIHASGMTVERRFASWIGGSILASLGTFHQMWISKKEYDDVGPGIVEKRCK